MTLEKDRRGKETALRINETLAPEKRRLFECITKKGASNWLTAMPLKKYDFYLDKQSFWDAIYLRYGFRLSRLPSSCVCGSDFSIEHALTCSREMDS